MRKRCAMEKEKKHLVGALPLRCLRRPSSISFSLLCYPWFRPAYSAANAKAALFYTRRPHFIHLLNVKNIDERIRCLLSVRTGCLSHWDGSSAGRRFAPIATPCVTHRSIPIRSKINVNRLTIMFIYRYRYITTKITEITQERPMRKTKQNQKQNKVSW